MSLHFYAYARKGYEFTDDIASKLNSGDTEKAGRLVRCVFRALRKELSMEASFRLIANLPMALKAVYVDGWQPGVTPTSHDFISEVLNEDARSAWRDLSMESDAKHAVVAVFSVLKKFIGRSEMASLLSVLPDVISQELNTDFNIETTPN